MGIVRDKLGQTIDKMALLESARVLSTQAADEARVLTGSRSYEIARKNSPDQCERWEGAMLHNNPYGHKQPSAYNSVGSAPSNYSQ